MDYYSEHLNVWDGLSLILAVADIQQARRVQ